MNILFDTSVWIEYFKGHKGYFETGQQYLEKGIVVTTEIVFAELLQGALNKREIELIKAYYELIPKIEVEQLFIKAGEYSCEQKLISKGIGIIDAAIIVSTMESEAKLWTLDKKIKAFIDSEYLFQEAS